MDIEKENVIKGTWIKENETITAQKTEKYILKGSLWGIENFVQHLARAITDLPTHSICITTNGSKYLNLIGSKMYVKINGIYQKEVIYMYGKSCFESLIKGEEVTIITQYSYLENGSNKDMSNLDNYLTNPIEKRVEISPIAKNIVINSLVLIISLLAIFWLSNRIVLLWKKGYFIVTS